jgi:hypothetical protein
MTRFATACGVTAALIGVVLSLQAVTSLVAQRPAAEPPAKQAGHGAAKLVIWGDIALFQPRGHPMSCVTINRYKRGDPVGFRMTAIDGGTGEVEHTAVLTAHISYRGKTIDIPMRWRGAAGPTAPPPNGYLRVPVEMWTGEWEVPMDAPVGMLLYTVSAKDAFGRTATFQPFPHSASQLTIVE